MVLNLDTNAMLANRLIIAKSFWRRFKGLMFHKELPSGEGMLLAPCSSVHTFFMCFAIDVIYLDSSLRVVAVYEQVAPWRALFSIRGVNKVLELPTGTIKASGTSPGHRLMIKNMAVN